MVSQLKSFYLKYLNFRARIFHRPTDGSENPSARDRDAGERLQRVFRLAAAAWKTGGKLRLRNAGPQVACVLLGIIIYWESVWIKSEGGGHSSISSSSAYVENFPEVCSICLVIEKLNSLVKNYFEHVLLTNFQNSVVYF